MNDEVLLDDPENQRAELSVWFDSFICPLPSSAKDVFAIIGQRLTSLGFSDTPYHAEQVQRVSLTPMLTIDFMAEMGFNIDEPVYAYQYDLLCSADFVGTDQCQLQYKVLLIDTAKPEPYVLLVESLPYAIGCRKTSGYYAINAIYWMPYAKKTAYLFIGIIISPKILFGLKPFRQQQTITLTTAH
jgi:hypothetical protein